MTSNDIAKSTYNFQKGNMLQLTVDYRIPDPMEANSEETLRAKSQFEFIDYVGDEYSELLYEKVSGLRVKVLTEILTRPTKNE